MNIFQRAKIATAVMRKGIDGIPIINREDFSGMFSNSSFQRTSKGDMQAYVNNFTSWVYAAVSCIARSTAKVATRLYAEKSKGSRESGNRYSSIRSWICLRILIRGWICIP